MQYKLLDYLDKDDTEESYQNLIQFFTDMKIQTNHQDLRLFLHLITKIANNHHRTQDFYSKIERILDFFKAEIHKSFSNNDIFIIFKSNKRILLYLIKEKIINFDKSILKTIISKKYTERLYFEYFLPEIKDFLNENKISLSENLMQKLNKELPNEYEEYRKIGENENIICKIIRNDSLDEFTSFIQENNLDLKSFKIQKSIYETNSLLLKREVSVIEYAAFFGSTQIFKYLFENYPLNRSIWNYAIHANKNELITFFVEKQIKLENDNYIGCFKESIKCHHNEIVNYFSSNNLHQIDKHDFIVICKYFNFSYFEDEFINQPNFSLFCKYDYVSIVDFFVKNTNIEINYTGAVFV